jgi:hypothetical protein
MKDLLMEMGGLHSRKLNMRRKEPASLTDDVHPPPQEPNYIHMRKTALE